MCEFCNPLMKCPLDTSASSILQGNEDMGYLASWEFSLGISKDNYKDRPVAYLHTVFIDENRNYYLMDKDINFCPICGEKLI